MNLTQFNPMKCLVYAEKIHGILRNEISSPVLAHLDLTNKCNYSCSWCYVKKYISNETEMSFVTASKIINELADYGVRFVIFSGGGEPTLHPDFLRIIQLVADRGLKIGLATNGSQLYKLVDELPFEAFKYIRISFDAGREETYARVHQTRHANFTQVLETARAIRCQVGMAFLATSYNYSEIPEALKWAENYDFDYISIRPVVYGHSGRLSEKQLKEVIEILNGLKNASVKIHLLRSRFDSLVNKKKYSCRSTPLATVITADGELNLCCQHRGNPKYQWGNLQKESFKELWGNQLHRTLLNEIKNEPCIDCVCKMSHYNQIIEEVFVKDGMHLGFL